MIMHRKARKQAAFIVFLAAIGLAAVLYHGFALICR